MVAQRRRRELAQRSADVASLREGSLAIFYGCPWLFLLVGIVRPFPTHLRKLWFNSLTAGAAYIRVFIFY